MKKRAIPGDLGTFQQHCSTLVSGQPVEERSQALRSDVGAHQWDREIAMLVAPEAQHADGNALEPAPSLQREQTAQQRLVPRAGPVMSKDEHDGKRPAGTVAA